MLRAALVSSFVVPALCAPATAQLAFSDQTSAAGVWAPSTHSGVTDGLTGDEMFQFFNGGVGIGDFDGDGDGDLYVPAGGLRRDKLYLNNGDGTFTNVAKGWGVADGFQAGAVNVADFDADGLLDVFVLSHGPTYAPAPGHHRLYKNTGGAFVDVAQQAGVQWTAAITDGHGTCFGDYDLDGDLDLFVGGWRQVPQPSMGNRLFRNEGNGTFTDVSAAAGVDLPDMRSFSPCFADMNGDRYPELLVAADFRTSRYFVNNGDGTFDDVTLASGTGQDNNGMGAFVGDVNNDGLLDWYVTSVYELPTNPVRDGNKLYVNLGADLFDEVAAAAGVDDGAWGWGTVGVDLDHDGWLDIAETNGWPVPTFLGVNSRIWINDGTGAGFAEVAVQSGLLHPLSGRACVNLDYDLDGDQDLVFTANQGFLRLFRNDLVHGPNANWLRVELDTSANPGLAPNGIGSLVTVSAGGSTYVRCLDAGSHYMGNSELALHFGLGSASVIDQITVDWNDGTQTVRTTFPANRHLTIAAPAP